MTVNINPATVQPVLLNQVTAGANVAPNHTSSVAPTNTPQTTTIPPSQTPTSTTPPGGGQLAQLLAALASQKAMRQLHQEAMKKIKQEIQELREQGGKKALKEIVRLQKELQAMRDVLSGFNMTIKLLQDQIAALETHL